MDRNLEMKNISGFQEKHTQGILTGIQDMKNTQSSCLFVSLFMCTKKDDFRIIAFHTILLHFYEKLNCATFIDVKRTLGNSNK